MPDRYIVIPEWLVEYLELDIADPEMRLMGARVIVNSKIELEEPNEV